MILTLSYVYIAFVLFAGQTLCQQAATYSNAAAGQTQTTLEDIERDNLKNPPPSQSSSPSLQPQYLQYQTPDQYNQYYKLAQQQPLQYVPQGQQSYAAATPLYTVPNQQALYPATQQTAAQALYPAAQQTAAAAYSPNQQPLIFYTQTKHPTIDFAGVSLFPVGNPYGQNAAGSPLAAANAGGVIAPSARTAPAQVPNAAAYVLPPSAYQQQYPQQYSQQYPQQLPQQYYQPIGLNQAPNAQYLYNTLYQLQTPQKSIYSAGIKSTTPAIPTKGGRDDFVPIGGGSNYYTSNSDPYAKSRISS